MGEPEPAERRSPTAGLLIFEVPQRAGHRQLQELAACLLQVLKLKEDGNR